MSHDHESFRQLVESSQRMLRAYCAAFGLRGADLDDIGQEIYLDYWRDPDARPGHVPELAWLKGMARHRCLNLLRRRGASQVLLEGMAEALAPTELDEADISPCQLAVQHCLDELPDQRRDLLTAFYAGSTVSSLVGHFAGSQATLRKLLHRLRELMRDCVQRRLDGDPTS